MLIPDTRNHIIMKAPAKKVLTLRGESGIVYAQLLLPNVGWMLGNAQKSIAAQKGTKSEEIMDNTFNFCDLSASYVY